MYMDKRVGDLVNHDKFGLGFVEDHPTKSNLFLVVFDTKSSGLSNGGLGRGFEYRCLSLSRTCWCSSMTLVQEGMTLGNV